MLSKMFFSLLFVLFNFSFTLADFIAPGPLPLSYFHLMSSGSPYDDTNGRFLTDYNISYINYQATGPNHYYNYTVVRGRVESIGSGHVFDTNKPLLLAQDVHGHLYRVKQDKLTDMSGQITANPFSLFFGGLQFRTEEPGSELICEKVVPHQPLNCSIAGSSTQNYFWTPDNTCDVLQIFFQDTEPVNLSNYLSVNTCQNFEKVNLTVVPASLGYSPSAYECEKPTKAMPAPAKAPKPSHGFYLSVSSKEYGDTDTVLQVIDFKNSDSSLADGAISYLGQRSIPPTLAIEASTGRVFDPVAFDKQRSYLAAGLNWLPSAPTLFMYPANEPFADPNAGFLTCQPFTDGKVVNCSKKGDSGAKFWIANSSCLLPYVSYQPEQPSGDVLGTTCGNFVQATFRAHAAPQPPPRPQYELIATFSNVTFPMNGEPLLTPVRASTPISFENGLNGPGRIFASRNPDERGFAAFDPAGDGSALFTKKLTGSQEWLSCTVHAGNLECGALGGKYILDWWCPINPLTGNTPILGCPLNWQTGFAKCTVNLLELDTWCPVGWY